MFANGRSIIHATTRRVQDTSPGGPVPVPYVNVAKSSDLAKPATPGLMAAADSAGFTRVDAFAMSPRQQGRVAAMGRKWDCAAPKLLQAGRLAAHDARELRIRAEMLIDLGMRPWR